MAALIAVDAANAGNNTPEEQLDALLSESGFNHQEMLDAPQDMCEFATDQVSECVRLAMEIVEKGGDIHVGADQLLALKKELEATQGRVEEKREVSEATQAEELALDQNIEATQGRVDQKRIKLEVAQAALDDLKLAETRLATLPEDSEPETKENK